jgi:chorismate mutase
MSTAIKIAKEVAKWKQQQQRPASDRNEEETKKKRRIWYQYQTLTTSA